MLTPLDDLVSIFSSVSTYQTGKNTLVLDRGVSSQLNFLTENHFSRFSSQANIDKILWYDADTISEQIQNTIDPTSPHAATSLVFLFNLHSKENFLKLDSFASCLRDTILPLNANFNVHLIVAHPSLDKSVEKYLSTIGVLGDLTSLQLWNSLLYFEISPDIYSLESGPDAAFSQLFLDNSPLPLELLAKLLLDLYISSDYKLRITNIYLKGEKSHQFWKIYERILDSHLQTLSDNQRKIIDDIDETFFMDLHSFYNNAVDFICLDRSNDIVSLLLTQLSYSGLCNEIFNPSNQLEMIQFKPSDSDEVMKFKLDDSSDDIYPQIKYLNFSHVGPVLNHRAKQLQLEFDRRKKLKDLDEMKSFVNELNSLKNMQSWVQKHTNLAGFIIHSFKKDALDLTSGVPLLDDLSIEPFESRNLGNLSLDSYYAQLIELQQDIVSNQINTAQILARISDLLINFNSSLSDATKLVVLTSIVKNGIKESDFQTLHLEMVNKFGTLQVTPILLNLQKLKILQIKNNNQQLAFWSFSDNSLLPSKSQSILNFASLSKSLNLLPLHGDEDRSDGLFNDLAGRYTDADFGYPGYVPVFARLIQSIYDRSFLNPPNSAVENRKPTQQQIDSRRAIKYGWSNVDLDQLSGPTKQEFLVPESKRKLFNAIIPPKISELKVSNSQPNAKLSAHFSTVVICAVGGITGSELAAIKYVLSSNSFTKNKRIIILTTGMINGTQFINSMSNPA